MRSSKTNALVVCTALGLALGCSSDEPPREVVRPVISITVADAASFSESTLPGRAKAAQEADLAFEVEGKLVERNVDVGDRVERGQQLASLDARDFEARLLAARGSYRTAKADYERAEALLAQQALAENVRDRRRAQLDVADGELRRAEKALEDTKIIAPFSGTVSATYLENFQNVLPKQRVLRIVDSTQIEFELSVPESLISLVPHVYDVVVVFDNYPDRKLPARVTEVGDEASAATRTYPVTLVIDPPEDLDIKPGMAGKATGRADPPPDGRGAGIEIPLAALFAPPDDPEKRSYVWIVDTDSLQVSRREVKVQELTAWGAQVDGLESGERVVTVGVHHLRDGQKVSLLD